MPTVVLRVDHARCAASASEAAMRRLAEALWAAADALPELPDAEHPDILCASREATAS